MFVLCGRRWASLRVHALAEPIYRAQGQLHWEVCLTSVAVQCCLLSPEDTQQGWVLAAAVHDRVRCWHVRLELHRMPCNGTNACTRIDVCSESFTSCR